MADPIETEAPDDSGSVTVRRFEYQIHICVQPVLEMLAGGTVSHVTCEHIEDLVVARRGDPRCIDDVFWDFQQIKTRDAVEAWTLTDVLASKPLKSLWRTHGTVAGTGLTYQLTAGIEGHLDPADEAVQALSKGQGGDNAACRKRIATHLKVKEDALTDFLPLVRIRPLPRRGDIELRNTRILADLGPGLTMAMIDALYNELLRRTRDAAQGLPVARWTELLLLDNPPPAVLDKRLSAASIADVRQRLTRPDHVLLEDLSQQLHGRPETALVRKLRAGAASREVIEEAQMFRAHAERHRFKEMALGAWPADQAIETDLDQRLLLLARRTGRSHKGQHQPADGIFDELQRTLDASPGTYDRHPLYAQDGVLLMGRACAISDECKFDWGSDRDAP